MKFLLTASLILLLLAIDCLAADTPEPENGFVGLFDGKSLDGWKVGESGCHTDCQCGASRNDC